MEYLLDGVSVDSVELKCLLVSRGLRTAQEVYRKFGGEYRIHPNALRCSAIALPDGTVATASDLGFHPALRPREGLRPPKRATGARTDFALALSGSAPLLTYKGREVCEAHLLPGAEFYGQKCASGLPFLGSAALEGREWLSLLGLWPCEYATEGRSCGFCEYGAQLESMARHGRLLPELPEPEDTAEIINWAVEHAGVTSVQLAGGATFEGEREACYIGAQLRAVTEKVGRAKLTGEVLLHITPPEDPALIDRCFEQGADRVVCSLEVWDDALAAELTPGKREFAAKERYLAALGHIAERFGPGRACSNFTLGLEPLESLAEGARYLAERGIVPTLSVQLPLGKPVYGASGPPGIEYFRRAKELFAELYVKYGLCPPGGSGLNASVGSDIRRWADGR